LTEELHAFHLNKSNDVDLINSAVLKAKHNVRGARIVCVCCHIVSCVSSMSTSGCQFISCGVCIADVGAVDRGQQNEDCYVGNIANSRGQFSSRCGNSLRHCALRTCQ
jgi:hypothetical protein